MNKNFSQKLIVLLAVFVLLGVFTPQHFARADVMGFLGLSFEAIVAKITGFFVSLAGNAISWLASLIDSFIQYQTDNGIYGVFVVDQSWKIIRNFVNMFFILVLIIMAFGTIFGMEKYSYRQMLGPFLIAALLVNFSLVIGQYIISFANGLSSVFLKQMSGLGATLVQGTSLVKVVTNDSALKLAGDIVGAGPNIAISAIFSVVFLVVALIALLAIAIFTVARLFMLWFLLIISPIAWIGYSFPFLRQRTWGEWWKNFFCWCFFLPYYLFFMLFALMFIQNKNNPALKMADPSQTLLGLSANDFLFYSLSIIFMVGGLGIAKKMACASGTGVAKVFGAIEGAVGGYVKRTTGYTGLKKGLRAKSEEVLEKGAFGIPGLQAGRIREAKIAERFSFGALRGEQERQLIKETGNFKDKIKDRSETDLKGMMSRGPITQQLAARELLKEKGLLDVSQLLETYELYRGKNAKGAAARFLGTIDFKDLSGDERRRIDEKLAANQDIADTETRRKLAKARAEKGDYKKDAVGLENAAKLFSTEGDKLDIINKARKYSVKTAAEVEARMSLVRDEANRVIEDYETAMVMALSRSIKRAKIDDILEYSNDTLKELRDNADFIQKFKEQKFRENFLSRASQGQLEAIQPSLNRVRVAQLEEDMPKLQQELANKEALRQQTEQNQQTTRSQAIDLQARLTEAENILRETTDPTRRQELSRQIAGLRFDSEQLVQRANELSRRLAQADEDVQKTARSIDELGAERDNLSRTT